MIRIVLKREHGVPRGQSSGVNLLSCDSPEVPTARVILCLREVNVKNRRISNSVPDSHNITQHALHDAMLTEVARGTHMLKHSPCQPASCQVELCAADLSSLCTLFSVQRTLDLPLQQNRSHYISSIHTRLIRCLTLRRVHLT